MTGNNYREWDFKRLTQLEEAQIRFRTRVLSILTAASRKAETHPDSSQEDMIDVIWEGDISVSGAHSDWSPGCTPVGIKNCHSSAKP